MDSGEVESVNIYVGNLPYSTTDAELESLFSGHGTVTSARVIIDRETGRSRGFGFVEMASDEEGRAAIAAMNGNDSMGRALTVNEAKPKEAGARGGGFGGGGGFGRGGDRGSRW